MSSYKDEAKKSRADRLEKTYKGKAHPRGDIFNDTEPFDGVPQLSTTVPAGKMPIGPQRFKRGGKVADMTGKDCKTNLGKGVRKRAEGGNVPLPPPRPKDLDQKKVPMPPRRTIVEEYEAEHPNERKDLGSTTTGYARGGIIGATPQQRKKVIGAMVARKKMEGLPTAAPKKTIVPQDMASPLRKSGGKVSHAEWEHSKKDLKQDKKLAKKHGMSLEKWEKSAADKKHDKQQSMEGLKHGGRAHRKEGGRVGKGKTTVNIMISPQQAPQQPLGAGVGMGAPPMTPPIPPMPPAMPVGMPPAMPPMMGAAGAGPGLGAMPALMPGRPGMSAPVPPMRKSGGRVKNWMPKHQETEFGSGSGLGRIAKTKWPIPDGTA